MQFWLLLFQQLGIFAVSFYRSKQKIWRSTPILVSHRICRCTGGFLEKRPILCPLWLSKGLIFFWIWRLYFEYVVEKWAFRQKWLLETWIHFYILSIHFWATVLVYSCFWNLCKSLEPKFFQSLNQLYILHKISPDQWGVDGESLTPFVRKIRCSIHGDVSIEGGDNFF